ncbi:MAG TPA: chalcone isomerase family protein [Burkholderiales bacterium]
MDAAFLAISALAATLAGAQIPDALETEAGTLRLVSCGVRDTLWVDHYVAGLYVPPGATAQAVRDAGEPKAVRMQVLNAQWLPDNVPEKWRGALRKELRREPMAQVRAAYHRLTDGDVVTFTYLPGSGGVRMTVNGHRVMQTPGHEVIQTILEAWAERDPISGKLHRLRLEHPC